VAEVGVDVSAGASVAMSASSAVAPATDGRAIDPVCGMSVIIAGAAQRAEHGGRAYYFCCGGCRARFVAAPASYLGQAGAG